MWTLRFDAQSEAPEKKNPPEDEVAGQCLLYTLYWDRKGENKTWFHKLLHYT